MKNLAIKAAVLCILVFGMAIAANAQTTLPLTTGTYPGGVAAGWLTGFQETGAYISETVDYTPGWDRLDIYWGTASGNIAGSQMVAIQGSFTITGATGMELVSDAGAAACYADNGVPYWPSNGWGYWTNATGHGDSTILGHYGQSSNNLSFVNMADSVVASPWSRTGSAELFSSFSGAWQTGGGTGVGDGGRFARLFVPDTWGGPGSSFTFDAAVGFNNAGSNSENAQLQWVATPEPTTLVLLATGLIGLLAYAWRKRK